MRIPLTPVRFFEYAEKIYARYSFLTTFSTEQIGRGLAYYYGQIKKKERKFYILCQDYMFGHAMAEGLKYGLKEYYPGAEIIGQDYHKLFLTDFAPLPHQDRSLRRGGGLRGGLDSGGGQPTETGEADEGHKRKFRRLILGLGQDFKPAFCQEGEFRAAHVSNSPLGRSGEGL